MTTGIRTVQPVTDARWSRKQAAKSEMNFWTVHYL
jgi:hypothetical protein